MYMDIQKGCIEMDDGVKKMEEGAGEGREPLSSVTPSVVTDDKFNKDMGVKVDMDSEVERLNKGNISSSGNTGSGSVSTGSSRSRRKYVLTKRRKYWTEEEHSRFMSALRQYGRDWKAIERVVATKNTIQIRSHAQKHFKRLEQTQSEELLKIPPPRRRKKGVKHERTKGRDVKGVRRHTRLMPRVVAGPWLVAGGHFQVYQGPAAGQYHYHAPSLLHQPHPVHPVHPVHHQQLQKIVQFPQHSATAHWQALPMPVRMNAAAQAIPWSVLTQNNSSSSDQMDSSPGSSIETIASSSGGDERFASIPTPVKSSTEGLSARENEVKEERVDSTVTGNDEKPQIVFKKELETEEEITTTPGSPKKRRRMISIDDENNKSNDQEKKDPKKIDVTSLLPGVTKVNDTIDHISNSHNHHHHHIHGQTATKETKDENNRKGGSSGEDADVDSATSADSDRESHQHRSAVVNHDGTKAAQEAIKPLQEIACNHRGQDTVGPHCHGVYNVKSIGNGKVMNGYDEREYCRESLWADELVATKIIGLWNISPNSFQGLQLKRANTKAPS